GPGPRPASAAAFRAGTRRAGGKLFARLRTEVAAGTRAAASRGRPHGCTALAMCAGAGLRYGRPTDCPRTAASRTPCADLARRLPPLGGSGGAGAALRWMGLSPMDSSVTREPAPLRVDLHAHTRFSPDAAMSPRELVDRALDAGVDRIAVTDHGEIEGALEARAYAPAHVIVGEEIRCEGKTELIGLFL